MVRLLEHHVLANLTFAVVLVIGFLSYALMPREENPSINFNWIDITTALPGASASDIEKRVTDVLEEAVRKVQDIRFVASTSRDGVSNILIRFNEIDERTFDKRISDLRREVQSKSQELPKQADDPVIFEVTSANAFPTATLVVKGTADDATLRQQAEIARKGIERIQGVDRILAVGLSEPELQVDFFPERLQRMGIAPADLADTVEAFYNDIAAGSLRVNGENWLVRLIGTDREPGYLAKLPVITVRGEVPLGSLADVKRGRTKPAQLVRFNGQPGVMFGITKRAKANVLELVARITAYIDERNAQIRGTGVQLVLVDDRTETTRDALRVMQSNAVLGLGLVLLVTWLFLGGRIAMITCIGIPFVLAGTFWILRSFGQTLNVSVLLGAVISLGMLVDDAVVVVEAIYYRLERGVSTLQAVIDGLREVAAPVTTAVLTTAAAFLPLMLLPGILGQFMLVIPLVVTLALSVSLVEAYWMLPAHIIAAKVNFQRPSRIHRVRVRSMRRIRSVYTRVLIRTLRYPKTVLCLVGLLFVLSLGAVAGKLVRVDFFASDPIRLFYVNVQMPAGTPLSRTLDKMLEIEAKVRTHLREGEERAVLSYAGQMFTETAPFFGEQYGQVMVVLNPQNGEWRGVDEVIEAMRRDVEQTPGPERLVFLRLSGGIPASKPIRIKVRGEELDEIRSAAEDLKAIMHANPAIRDITDDAATGPMEFALRVDLDAARRAGLDPRGIARNVQLFVNGEVVASMQDRGQKLEIRVRAQTAKLKFVHDLLDYTLPSAAGDIPLKALLEPAAERGVAAFRHHNFRRTITVEADIDTGLTDTVTANQGIVDAWKMIRDRHPNIDLDSTGAFDDIEESLDAIGALFLLGVGLMYLILGVQFRSYFQPLMILTSVPLAFIGVVLGLLITHNPLSLMTMYGVVALAGIAVNAAIVLISAANSRLAAGMPVAHAAVLAARRRVIPILITSLTTIAGLLSLATGLAGRSLLWGPVATAIIWGLAFSTVLTLLVVPTLYCLSMGRRRRPATR